MYRACAREGREMFRGMGETRRRHKPTQRTARTKRRVCRLEALLAENHWKHKEEEKPLIPVGSFQVSDHLEAIPRHEAD